MGMERYEPVAVFVGQKMISGSLEIHDSQWVFKSADLRDVWGSTIMHSSDIDKIENEIQQEVYDRLCDIGCKK